MSKFIARLLPLLLLVVLFNPASAQQPNPALNLKLGDAVVTGFSGTITSGATQRQGSNKSETDLTFINPDGPSARVIDISRPGYVWDGRLFAAPKTFDVLAKDVGQVFGVALDDSAQPNIYVAATSVFGLNIVSRGRDGTPERRKKGGPGAGWMKGQFGLDLQGGPGGIYKIDGRTGVVSLFANVTLDGVPNPGPGLGNLAYDSAHKQLFVSDLYTGMIHRFDLDGKELSRYDHGVMGLGASKRATVPFDAKNRPNIASERFDSENPATWGLAPPARRVWGLAVHEGRLYYSVVAGPQIWSVGLTRDGDFADNPRWELDLAAQGSALPVSDIAFSQPGAMILAQRALIAASYDYSAFTQAGEPRVLRYWLKDPNDPPSPGRWKLSPEEYAIGFADTYRNSNGGVALGYGYNQDGTLGAGACEAALWSTGQNLRNNPALRSQLEPGGPLVVHGLQGSPADLVRNANTPPAISYFIDYDDKFDDPAASGHIGSVRVYTTPCAPSAYVRPVVATPVGGGGGGGCVGPNCGNVCTPTCVCPPGTVLEGRECVKRDCPPPQVFNPATGACACPRGTVLRDGKCVPIIRSDLKCVPPQVFDPATGACACPQGLVLVNGACVSVHCRPPLVFDPVTKACACPQGGVLQDGKCVPQICPSPLVPGPCKCPDGTVQDGGLCVPLGKLTVLKRVDNETGHPIPNLSYSVDVVCGPPANQTWHLVLINGVPQTVNGIAFGSTCTVNEPVLPPPPPNICPKGTVAVWDPPIYTPPNVVIGGTTVTVMVRNVLRCKDQPVGTLSVTKKVDPDPRGLATSLSFPMTVTCTNPPAPPFSYTLTVHGNTSSVPHNVPVGSHCTVTEGALPALPAGCTWLPPVFSPPGGVTIASGLNQETVTNGYRCREQPSSLIFKKVVIGGGAIALPNMTFPVNVNCGGTITVLNLSSDGTPQTINNIPFNTSCSFTEGSVLPHPNICPPNTTENWNIVWTPSNQVTVAGSVITVTVQNELICRPVIANTCPPPQVMNADGKCVCPPPQVMNAAGVCTCPPPMVTGPVLNTCVCPDGGTLVDGKCVPKIICDPPLVFIPGAGCRCPDGGTLVGGKCVRPIDCRAPLIPNADGTKCVCPAGEILSDDKCVKISKRKETPTCKRGFVWNGDMCVKRKIERKEEKSRERPDIRIPGGLPGLGGGRGQGGTGGGGGVRGR